MALKIALSGRLIEGIILNNMIQYNKLMKIFLQVKKNITKKIIPQSLFKRTNDLTEPAWRSKDSRPLMEGVRSRLESGS